MAVRRSAGWPILALMSGAVLAGCAATPPLPDPPAEPPPVAAPPSPRVQRGIASWYGPGFHGRRTANGERFNQNAMTAAHRSLPIGTMVTVRNLENGRTVRVRINDRGPYIRGRVIDLSRAAARALGIIEDGVARVALEWHPPGSPDAQTASVPDDAG